MKITRRQLRQLIKEEASLVLELPPAIEEPSGMFRPDTLFKAIDGLSDQADQREAESLAQKLLRLLGREEGEEDAEAEITAEARKMVRKVLSEEFILSDDGNYADIIVDDPNLAALYPAYVYTTIKDLDDGKWRIHVFNDAGSDRGEITDLLGDAEIYKQTFNSAEEAYKALVDVIYSPMNESLTPAQIKRIISEEVENIEAQKIVKTEIEKLVKSKKKDRLV